MGLKHDIIQINSALNNAEIDHALIGGFAQSYRNMTFMEYLDFLDEYWELFGPPPAKEIIIYKNVRL